MNSADYVAKAYKEFLLKYFDSYHMYYKKLQESISE